MESVEWKKLVDEHESKLKKLEEKYKSKCEAEQVGLLICKCLVALYKVTYVNLLGSPCKMNALLPCVQNAQYQ